MLLSCDLSDNTQDRPAAIRDTTTVALSVAISRSRREYPRTTANRTTIIAPGKRPRPRGELRPPKAAASAMLADRQTRAPDVASNEPPAGGEDLRPAQNANGVPQSGRPKWIRLHERVDHVGAVGFNDPQAAGGIA